MKYLFLIFQLFIVVVASAQSTGLPLQFQSYAISLGVGKDESLALTTKMGEVGLAGSINHEWRRVDVKADKPGFGTTLEKPNFFNKDTGFVSGFINSGSGKYDIIYHTTNGGQKWQVVNLGQDGWVDDATNLDNGEAWLSVAGSGIAYTTDYGVTWSKFKNPDPKQRFAAIFFNTNRQGIIGSLWNLVAYTGDNCKTWKWLPTPLDQKKYNKTNKASKPGFEQVAIFKDYFLASQEGLVFYSSRDSVDWKWLPDYSDFFTDPENTALFFKTNKGSYVRSDSSFTPAYVFDGDEISYDAKCKNGSLFIVSNNKMIQLNSQDRIISTLFAEKATADKEPVSVGYTATGLIGLLDNKVCIQKEYKGRWDHLFTFPFSLKPESLSVVEEGLLMYDRGDDSLFYFNHLGELKKKESKIEMLTGFSKSGIKELVFSQGSRGCFHNYSDQLIYKNFGGEFGSAIEVSHDAKNSKGMPDNDLIIDVSDVSDFARQLPIIFDPNQKPSIQDLAFSEEDYEQCRKDILAFQASLNKQKGGKEPGFAFHRNNLDFNRLLSLVDSIRYIDAKTLNVYLRNLSDIWSTTTNWKKMQLINNDNEVLSITSNYYEPNAFYFPWTVSLNGYTISTNNIIINRFFEEVYPSFLNGPKKVNVLHTLVKNLY
jgi:general stress protein 26